MDIFGKNFITWHENGLLTTHQLLLNRLEHLSWVSERKNGFWNFGPCPPHRLRGQNFKIHFFALNAPKCALSGSKVIYGWSEVHLHAKWWNFNQKYQSIRWYAHQFSVMPPLCIFTMYAKIWVKKGQIITRHPIWIFLHPFGPILSDSEKIIKFRNFDPSAISSGGPNFEVFGPLKNTGDLNRKSVPNDLWSGWISFFMQTFISIGFKPSKLNNFVSWRGEKGSNFRCFSLISP